VDETLGAIIDQLDKAANHVNQFNEEIGGPLDDFEIGDEFSELTSGINEMAIQYQKFHDGLVAYTGGVSELATNYTSLNDGMSELSNGMNELEGGTSELYLGTDKLARSTSD